MGLGKTRVPSKIEERFLTYVEQENSKLRGRIARLEDTIKYCEMKIKANDEFIENQRKSREVAE